MNMKLAAKVKSLNACNVEAMKWHSVLVEIFRPLVGKPILKADGSLLAKYKALLPEFPCSPSFHVWRHSSNYSLAWTVRVGVSEAEHTWSFSDVTVYIGDLNGAVLADLKPSPQFRTDYTVLEVELLRIDFKKKQDAFENARSALYPFGEYDS